MKIGIAIEDWKLPVFRHRLTEAGYEYKDGGALMPDCTLLTVVTDNILALGIIVRACQAECARKSRSRK